MSLTKTILCQIDKIEEGKATLIPIDERLCADNLWRDWLLDEAKESDVVEITFKLLPELKERERGMIRKILERLKSKWA